MTQSDSSVRVGIIGVGNMGSAHARTLLSGTIKGAELVAVCDIREMMRDWVSEQLSPTLAFGQMQKRCCLQVRWMLSF